MLPSLDEDTVVSFGTYTVFFFWFSELVKSFVELSSTEFDGHVMSWTIVNQ